MTLSERSRSLGEGGHSPIAGRRRLYDSPIFTRSTQGGCVDSRPRARLADETQFDSKPQSLTPFSPPLPIVGWRRRRACLHRRRNRHFPRSIFRRRAQLRLRFLQDPEIGRQALLPEFPGHLPPPSLDAHGNASASCLCSRAKSFLNSRVPTAQPLDICPNANGFFSATSSCSHGRTSTNCRSAWSRTASRLGPFQCHFPCRETLRAAVLAADEQGPFVVDAASRSGHLARAVQERHSLAAQEIIAVPKVG